jgi:hypothetical protein
MRTLHEVFFVKWHLYSAVIIDDSAVYVYIYIYVYVCVYIYIYICGAVGNLNGFKPVVLWQ